MQPPDVEAILPTGDHIQADPGYDHEQRIQRPEGQAGRQVLVEAFPRLCCGVWFTPLAMSRQ